MSQVVIAGDTSGTITLQAPAVSGSSVLTLPATTGTLLTTASATNLTSNLTFSSGTNGIVFNNTSATTNSTLNDYETGTWTPVQGSGLTVVGSFTSSGKYTKIGNMVFLQGSVTGSTSVALANGGVIATGTPFTSASGYIGIGGATNANGTTSGTTDCGPNQNQVSGTPAIVATGTIYFSLTYQATF